MYIADPLRNHEKNKRAEANKQIMKTERKTTNN